jgi:hypothetical protein
MNWGPPSSSWVKVSLTQFDEEILDTFRSFNRTAFGDGIVYYNNNQPFAFDTEDGNVFVHPDVL